MVLSLLLPVIALAQTEPPPLAPGDRLEIVVFRSPELTGTYTITARGTPLHPLFEHVQVAGLPIEQARQRMESVLLEELADPRFTFEPLYRVYVGGDVRGQGEYHLRDMTIAQAILNAGGSTAPDRNNRLRLVRDGVETVVNMDGSSETELLQTHIRPGDQILIESRPTFSRTYLAPAMQVLQTVTALVGTYVYFNAIFGE